MREVINKKWSHATAMEVGFHQGGAQVKHPNHVERRAEVISDRGSTPLGSTKHGQVASKSPALYNTALVLM